MTKNLMGAVLTTSFLLNTFLFLLFWSDKKNQRDTSSVWAYDRQTILKQDISFRYESKHAETLNNLLPTNIHYCEDILPENHTEIYPNKFRFAWQTFKKTFVQYYKKGKDYEGSIVDRKAQQFLYYNLANLDFVTTVCEIGFNGGHSAFFWLASSVKTMVYSFDLGTHHYTKAMVAHLKEMYADRFHIIYGDSTKTVPAFRLQRRDVWCDLLVIDGGHFYKVAIADLQNMRMLANQKHNIVVFDDYPAKMKYFNKELGPAWNTMIQENQVKQIFSCHNQKAGVGFSVGYYI